MIPEKLTLETPYGTRDLLSKDAAEMRHMENILSSLFQCWGYDEVVTPTIEYLDILTSRIQEAQSLFMLLSNRNKMLALRNEMTTPIARLVSSRLRNAPLPLKCFYIGNVFRMEETQSGIQCEFHQAGVEMMGINTPAADAEIIALAIESIRACGINDFQIHIGQVDFLEGILTHFEIGGVQQKKIKSALEKHDIVLMESIIDDLPLEETDRLILKKLPLLNGKEDLLQPLYDISHNERSRTAIDNLAEIYDLLKAYGITDYIRFDLGIIRDFNYYTGMVFEGYTPYLGFPLCGGGRYDHLLMKFGYPLPATGFALGMERVLLALDRQGSSLPVALKDVYIGHTSGESLGKAVQRSMELRRDGKTVGMGTKEESYEEAELSRKLHGYAFLEYFE